MRGSHHTKARGGMDRRQLLALGAAGVATMAGPWPASAQPAAPDPWPRLFSHVYGRAVLEAPARRVVSLGYTNQDPLLALGVVPVALRYWYGDEPNSVWPWARAHLGQATPQVLRGESNIEAIAALQPDLIVAIGAGITRAEYDILSQIAPVLMQPEGTPTYGLGWEETTRMFGRAVAREDRALAMITKTKQAFAAARARHPEWAGRRAVAAYHSAGETGVFAAIDGRARFLQSLGFVLPDDAAFGGGEAFYHPLSPEDLSPLDADVLLWIAAGTEASDLAALPMRKLLDAHKHGREVYAGPLHAAALSFSSVLSLPFAINALEADIAAAADGDPDTVVQSTQAAGLL